MSLSKIYTQFYSQLIKCQNVQFLLCFTSIKQEKLQKTNSQIFINMIHKIQNATIWHNHYKTHDYCPIKDNHLKLSKSTLKSCDFFLEKSQWFVNIPSALPNLLHLQENQDGKNLLTFFKCSRHNQEIGKFFTKRICNLF